MSEMTTPDRKTTGRLQALNAALAGSRIVRSIFRHGYADTEKNRSLQIVSNLIFHLHPVRIKAHGLRIRFTWCLGGVTFLIFVVELVTGILLMFYYRPVVEYAYMDIKSLMIDVPFGRVLRNVHRWGAHLMVLTVMMHMLRVFLTGSYKPPREFNWVVGVLLLTGTLLLSFTGYLLPWDQLAYWAINVGTNMARATPLLGHEGPFALVDKFHDVRFLLLGGTEVGPSALLRFYVLHVILLPMVVLVFCAVHFWRVRKDGGISGPL
jgi:quinol-cytochrome oxidoreductase complex cytochrome b subunit